MRVCMRVYVYKYDVNFMHSTCPCVLSVYSLPLKPATYCRGRWRPTRPAGGGGRPSSAVTAAQRSVLMGDWTAW